MISPRDLLRLVRSHAPETSTREALVAVHAAYITMPRCPYRTIALRVLREQIDAWLDHPSEPSGRMDPVHVHKARQVIGTFLQKNPELTSKYLAPARPTC